MDESLVEEAVFVEVKIVVEEEEEETVPLLLAIKTLGAIISTNGIEEE